MSISKISKRNVKDIFALTSLQDGMLYQYLKNPFSKQYFEQLSLNISGKLNMDLLKKAWSFVFETNDMMRTIFAWKGLSKPVQIILKKQEVPIKEINLSNIEENQSRFARLEQIKQDELKEGFNLETGPLFRITLCKMRDKSYELILSYHHILFDGWSTGIILKEFFQTYLWLTEGTCLEKNSKPPLSHYLNWLNSRDKEKEVIYWKKYLQGFDTKTSLPTDYHKSSEVSTIDNFTFNLSENLEESVNVFTQKEGVTIASLLHTCWGILLQRFNNTDDVLFGTVVSGRPSTITGIEEMVGLFVNTVPIRLKTEKTEKIVREVVKKVNANNVTRIKYEYMPLVDIKNLSDLRSEDSLFDSLLVVENYPIEKTLLNLDSCLKINSYSAFEMTNFDLTIAITLLDGIHLNYIYNQNLFKKESIERLNRYFTTILDQLVTKPEQEISKLNILSNEERSQLLLEFNQIEREFGEKKRIDQLFELQANKYPDRIAIRFKDEQLTYSQVNEKANRLARTLVAKGTKKETIIALMVEPSLEMIISILAILKAGAAYLPISPELPKGRIEYILKDSETNLLITKSQFTDRVSKSVEILNLDQVYLKYNEVSYLDKSGSLTDLAYVIYTSGSTGKPKGVLVEHASLINTLAGLQEKFTTHSGDSWLLKTTFMFDVSVSEIFGWIMGGGSLAILEKGAEKEPKRILEAIDEYQITHLNFVPSMLNYFVDFIEMGGEQLVSILNKLKYIMVAGEAISQEQVQRFYKLTKNVEFINLYGPTETTIYATEFPLIEAEKYGTVPIGKGLYNAKIYILDQNNHLQPVGFPGELCIGGEGVARGYLNRPELTEEKFIDHPFLSRGRIYRTGDLARWLPDGNIEFLGRLDHQVKIRGYRIELGEIENQLLDHPLIKEAVVINQGNHSDKYLIGYYVAEEEIEWEEIHSHLKTKLPDYMIPTYFMRIDQMPLSANGKIDRKSLPEFEANIKSLVIYEAPSNEIEIKLVQIWAEILQEDQIGVNDNFFLLGGHSLKATRLTSRIYKEFFVELPLQEVFENNTIKKLARCIQRVSKQQYTKIEKVEERDVYPVSSAQKRIWVLDQIGDLKTAYNMTGALIIKGKLNVDRLEQAFQRLVKRHETLRTSFAFIQDEPVQKIHENVEVSLMIEKNGTDSIEDILKAFTYPFNLSELPLFRAKLVERKENLFLLLVDMHHIISDGVSMQIIIRDLLAFYYEKELSELCIQYKDFAIWQNELLASEKMKGQEEFWLNEFSGLIPVLELPTDYTRSNMMTYEGDHIDFLVDEGLTKKLNQLAREHQVTLYMILLAAYNVLLSRYTGQEDIIIGSPIAGRKHTDLDDIIGMFVNTLALRNYPSHDQRFSDFLNEVKDKTLKSYNNQEYQFEMLVDQLGLERNINRNPLFDVMFVLQNMDNTPKTIEGLTFTPYESATRTTKFDLLLNVTEQNNVLDCTLEYSTELFKRETIERMGNQFNQLLEAIVANPETMLMDLTLMTEIEKNLLIYELNDTQADYSRDRTIHQLFEERVDLTPNQIAAVYGDQHLTYRELNEKANRLARTLRITGIIKDSIVGILTDRSLEMLIGVMGILKAGGAYLPINPNNPQERIQYLLKDSQATILLAQNKYLDKIKFNGESIDLNDEKFYDENGENLIDTSSFNDLAYIIYTSGSTGKPKGTMIEHQSVVNILMNMQREYPLLKDDTYLLKTTFTFDVSVTELFGWFFGHGRIAILPPGGEKNITTIVDSISQYNITHINFVSSMFSLFLAGLEEEKLEKIQSLKYVFVAGEAFPRTLVERSRAKLKNIKVENIYGPTETTIYVTKYSTEDLNNESIVPIGKPFNNVKAYILNKHNHLQPIGVPGELCISGECLARGYLNRPELTAEKFVANPFVPGMKMYRTGDLVRILSDGNIEFLGRIDDQVKVRGFRIELGEIENQLLQHELIKEVSVLAQEDKNGDKSLVAYMVAKEVTVGELRQFLLETLPEYMVPSYFVQLEKMPLNSNGKINRKVLPKPEGTFQLATEYVAPHNEIEEKLVEIWKDILGLSQIGVNDSFFELGGHSLTAMVLKGRIHIELEIEVSLSKIFKAKTIKGLATYIEQATKKMHVAIKPVAQQKYYETSSAQKRMYLLQQMNPTSTSYNMPGVYLIDGILNVSKVEHVFQELIKRHETLRTSYLTVGGRIVQKVDSEVNFRLEVLDRKDQEIEKIIEDFVRPFDLSQALLFRVGVHKLAEDQYLMVFDMHHIISDGVSMGIFVREFISLYSSQQLPELRVQYKDFAKWQNNLFTTEAFKDQEEYWIDQFKDTIPVLNLLTDYHRKSVQSFQGASIHFRLDEHFTSKLKTLSRETETTLFMILLAGYTILLSKYSGQKDIVVGSPIAGRSHPDLENVIGMFVNTLALRNNLEDKVTFYDLLNEVKENTLGAFTHQDYPFDTLVEKLDIPRDLSRNPIFDVMFVMHNMDIPEVQLPDISFKPYSYHTQISKFDLTLMVQEIRDHLEFEFEYATELYSSTSIQRMAGHLSNIIRTIADQPTIELGMIQMILDQEQEKILYEFNDTAVAYPKEKTIKQLFEEKVEQNGEQFALVFHNQTLTYGELNRKANQLARLLRTKGVGPDQIVGLRVERSLEMIIGVLAIIKAGSAYLPIEMDYPTERVEYMLKDASAKILLARTDQVTEVEFAGEVINIADQQWFKGDDTDLEEVNKHSDLIYVIYTSGSTGKPKGVMIQHQNVNRLITNSDVLLINEEDRILQTGSLAFDASTFEIWGSLLNGATLYLIRKEEILSTSLFAEKLKEYQITMMWLTSPLFNQFVEENADMFEPIRTLLVGGDVLSPKHINLVRNKFPYLQIINGYGPTESTTFVACYLIDQTYTNNIPIGRPIANTKIFILDDHNNLQPIGVPGELYIGGDGLARGYLNLPEMNREMFISNPFEPGTMLYRSGDVARWLSNGLIEFHGRKDHQVKIRGFRIELGEIENHLLKHPEIQEAVVVDLVDEKHGKYLAGYFVAGQDLSVLELRAFLAETLPDYMIPLYFIQLPKLALTSNGKVNRKALPKPSMDIHTGFEYVVATNEVEERLVDIWAEILGVEQVSIHDRFFELGGHSLKATKVASRVFKELEVQLPLIELFKNPTIRDLSNYIYKAKGDVYTTIKRTEKKEYYPVSSAQKNLLIYQQKNGPSINYNIPVAMIIKGKFDYLRFEKAIKMLVQRHESLRTSFHWEAGEPVQKVHQEIDIEITHLMVTVEELKETVQNFIKPFDLSKPGQLRAGYLEAEDRQILLFDMHHIISDGTSITILIKEFNQLYYGDQLLYLPLQYKDYVVWQNQILGSGQIQKQEKYWLDTFSGDTPVLNLPTDYHRGMKKSNQGDLLNFEIDLELTNQLKQLTQDKGVTLFMVMLAVYNVLLGKYGNTDDVIVGSPIAGRRHHDLEKIIGMFINTLPLRNRPHDEMTLTQFLQNVKENLLQAYENQEYQYEYLVDQLNVKTELSRNPLFDVMLVFQNFDQPEIKTAEYELIPYQFEDRTSKYDLTLYVVEKADGYDCNFRYNTTLFTKETVERFANELVKILKKIVSNPEITIFELKGKSNKLKQSLFTDLSMDLE